MQKRQRAMRIALATMLATTAAAWAATPSTSPTAPPLTSPAPATSPGQSAVQYMDDATVTTKVKASLLADKNVSGLSIQVTTSQGVVVLTGEVASETERKKAGELAAAVQGVKAVKNELKVKS